MSGAYSGSLCFSVNGFSPLSVAVTRHSDRKELREGVVSACTSRSVCCGGMWTVSSFSATFTGSGLSSSLYSVGPPLEEGCHPWCAGPCYINHQSRQFLTDMATGQSDLGNSSIETSFPLLSLDCVKSKEKLISIPKYWYFIHVFEKCLDLCFLFSTETSWNHFYVRAWDLKPSESVFRGHGHTYLVSEYTIS